MTPIPTLAAARLALEPYALAIKIGAIAAAVLLLAFAWWRISTWHDAYRDLGVAQAAQKAVEGRLAAEVACEAGTACEGRALRSAQDGAAEVAKARRAAQEAAQREQARVAADGQAAVERAQRAAGVATVRLREAEARLRQSIAEDATCAAQARETIKCAY